MVWRRIEHPKNRRLAEITAARLGVTTDHLIRTVAARRRYREGAEQRRRARRRSLAKNPGAFKRQLNIKLRYIGEGEFDLLMRAVGLNPIDFVRLTGIRRDLFTSWYGHPMHPWPLEFLRYYGWSMNMAKRLRELGVDPEKLKPLTPSLLSKKGHYPRKAGQEPQIDEGDYSPWKTF